MPITRRLKKWKILENRWKIDRKLNTIHDIDISLINLFSQLHQFFFQVKHGKLCHKTFTSMQSANLNNSKFSLCSEQIRRHAKSQNALLFQSQQQGFMAIHANILYPRIFNRLLQTDTSIICHTYVYNAYIPTWSCKFQTANAYITTIKIRISLHFEKCKLPSEYFNSRRSKNTA